VVYKRDWGFVYGHKVFFTLTHQERVWEEKERQRDRLGNDGWRAHNKII